MTVISVYNTALSAIGTKNTFLTVNDTGPEIETCNLLYDQVRTLVLRAAPWTSAKGWARLVVAVTRDPTVDWVVTDPPPGWLYSYTAPVDMLHPQYMTDFSRFDVGQSSANAKRIFSNSESPIFTYTKDQTSTATWDPDLTMAITYALAAHICIKLTGKHERFKLMQEMANNLIMSARMHDANVPDMVLDTVAPWHAARGFEGASETRYIFPYGPLVNVGYF